MAMDCITYYPSPLGLITLASDGNYLTGLWFKGQRNYASTLSTEHEERHIPLFGTVCRWLDTYFSGNHPDFQPPLHMRGTKFQQRVWQQLLKIPYGNTQTYGQIAHALGIRSAQAIGYAVSRNPLLLIVPCHRIVAANNQLGGYAAGTDRKQWLLKFEVLHFHC